MMRAISLLIALCMILSSCTTASIVDDPYGTFSRDEYLTARGYGPTAEKAELNAKVELASLFGANVKSVTARTIAEDKSGYSEAFMKTSEIVIDTEDLYGIEIAQTVKDKDGGYTSVAMMNKAAASARYRAEKTDMQKSLEAYETDGIPADGSFSSLEKAVEFCKLARRYNTFVSVINYLEGSMIPFYDTRNAEGLYSAISDSMCLEIAISGDDTGRVEAALATLLTDSGLKVSGGSDLPTAIAEGRISFRKVQGTGAAAAFVFAEYDIEIRLRDLTSDRAVFVFTSHGREGHQNYESAQSRALTVIEEELETAFAEQFKDRFSL